MAKNKEVAKRPSMGSREESFGGAPGTQAVAGGTMHLFGHRKRDGVWPDSPVSVDQKTGYPKGAQDKTKGSK